MIKEKIPITYIEAANLSKKTEKAEKLKKFVKEFVDIELNEVFQLKEKLKNLNIYKLKEESIVSLINFQPENSQEVLKILPESNLSEEEINKILEVFKKS